MDKNDKKIREILENEEIPEKLNPENIRIMLDEKAPAKKRKKLSVAGRITAAAAACAVIVGTAGYLKKDILKNCPDETIVNSTAKTSTENKEQIKAPYMSGAESYEQVYKLIEESDKKYKKRIRGDSKHTVDFEIAEETADGATPENGIKFDSTNSDNNYYIPETKDLKKESETIEEPNEFIPVTESETEAPTQTEITTEPTETETPSEVTAEPTESTTEQTVQTEATTEISTETTVTESEDDYSKTHNQEENVLEADIVKTDGERIYYLTNKEITGKYNDDGIYENYLTERFYTTPALNIASVDNGTFTDSLQLDVTPELNLDENWESEIFVNDMYLYNDMIAVIGTVNSHCKIEGKDEEYYDKEYDAYYTPYHYENDNRCFVSFYTKDAELIGTYWQDGCYSNVRIAPDGYMYLVSSYNSVSFEDIETAENIERYIPECGVDDSMECMPPENILLPEDILDNDTNMSYTIIGSIDLTVSAQFTPADSKALAGYTGEIYSSADNIYTTVGWTDTDITRISVSGGNIIPAASGTVEGYVKDQFSMSEYNGCFRIATTVNKWTDNSNFFTDIFDIPTESEHIANNRVYVLDMELNQVGYVGGFGENETIKSVNFSGNMGYVVTYEQTDPLFAIDLTNPAEPFITDEFKILGYSTYMQNWTDGLLLGFGADADENGIETGIKLVMFDNSDPYNLQEVGLYAINREENQSVSSGGIWDRKQLLIAPEKNLIGIPVEISEWTENYDDWNYTSKYMFFSYENGKFISKGEIAENTDNVSFNRAIYIGGYVYAVSANKFVSADMETITVTDEINFD